MPSSGSGERNTRATTSDWSVRLPGVALAGYGLFFREDLGWLGHGVITVGIAVATVGGALYKLCNHTWNDWWSGGTLSHLSSLPRWPGGKLGCISGCHWPR